MNQLCYMFAIKRPTAAKKLIGGLLFVFLMPLPGWTQNGNLNYEAGLHQQVDLFSDVYDAQHKTTLHLGINRSFGSYTVKLSRANRFNETGYQTEIETYPNFGNGYYGYWSYAYSGSSVFSRHRIGVEFYSRLPRQSEGSVGFRFLNFETGSESWMATFSMSHYWRSFLFTVRPYFVFSDDGNGQTYTGLIHHFLNEHNDYVGVRFSGGVASDSDFNQLRESVQEQFLLLNSYEVGLESRYHLADHLYARLEGGLKRQELSFAPGEYVGNWRFRLGLTYKF